MDLELKLDSGRFNIETIDTLMQMYSQAVEYYSGMNDEKYMFFTERIQNTLLRPEVLRLMKDSNIHDKGRREEMAKMQEEKKDREKKMSHDELMKLRQQEHEERKKMRVEKLHEA